MAFSYLLEYAGVPFFPDVARAVFPDPTRAGEPGRIEPDVESRFRPEVDLIDEINRKIPFGDLHDFAESNHYAGRNIGPLRTESQRQGNPSATVKIGQWYYPVGASRWSVFRGLMTSSQVKEVLKITAGRDAATFTMKATPLASTSEAAYTLSSSMYMLPPRPINELGVSSPGQPPPDGLFLVTLVDERYYGQFVGVKIRITRSTTWANLVTQLATALGYNVAYSPDVLAAYSQPEPDSPLWTNCESAAVLLDAVAANVGSAVVRDLDGRINLMQYSYSRTIAEANRARVRPPGRLAGGDIFQSGTRTAAGNLTASMNSVLPASVDVVFPKYVHGPGQPHFLDARGGGQNRPSAWFEDSYNDALVYRVPLLSGGLQFSGQLGVFISGSLQLDASGNPYYSSGLTGTSRYVPAIRTTAKATYSGEQQANDAATEQSPLNASGLRSLAMQLASDYFTNQIAVAYDEVFPGTFAWDPEGVHDIIWTYSERSRLASTRVMRTEWNVVPDTFQHATPPANPNHLSTNVAGVGGHVVAQAWKDEYDRQAAGSLITGMSATDVTTSLTGTYLPTTQRWKGLVDSEVILFEGVSGSPVGIAQRGCDGTLAEAHGANAQVEVLYPHQTYGVNVATFGKGQYVMPGVTSSGGIAGAHVIPQTQMVYPITSGLGNSTYGAAGLLGHRGVLMHFAPNGGAQEDQMQIGVVERNGLPLPSYKRYDGTFAGWNTLGFPIYLVNEVTTTQIYPPPISSGNPPPTFSGFSGNPPGFCPPSYLTESDLYCVSGVLKQYQRRVVAQTVFGCLQLQPSSWYFARNVGCCDCPTTSGSPPACVPGTCPTECLSGYAPYKWTVNANGFGGLCDVFNREWTMIQASGSSCVWTDSYQEGDLSVQSQVVVAGGRATLALTYGDGVNNVSTATFAGTILDENCCQSVTMEPDGENACQCGGELVTLSSDRPCGDCLVTPETWTINFTNVQGGSFTGCFASLATLQVVATRMEWEATSCIWRGSFAGGDLMVRVYPTGFSLGVQMDDHSAASWAVTNHTHDCCSVIALSYNSAFCGENASESSGTVPTIVFITPSCDGNPNPPDGDDGCPATITATPTCCEQPPGVPTCNPAACSYCGDETPVSWSFTVSGLTGRCTSLNQSWTVVQDAESSGCSYIAFNDDATAWTEVVIEDNGVTTSLTLYLRTNDGEVVTYVAILGESGSIDCCAEVTVSLVTGAALCDNEPNEIVLTPSCCSDPPLESPWWCQIDGTCVQQGTQPPGAGGPHTTQAACLAACGGSSPTMKYWCIDTGTGSVACTQSESAPPDVLGGPYDTQAECETHCTGSAIATNCCPSVDLPTTLVLTISDTTGTCSCLPSSVTLMWDAGLQQWQGNIPVTGDCATADFVLDCAIFPSANWVLSSTTLGFSTSFAVNPPNTVECSPLLIVWNTITPALECAGTFKATITV